MKFVSTVSLLLALAGALNAQTVPQLLAANTLVAYDSRNNVIGVVQSIDIDRGEVVVAFVLSGMGLPSDDTIRLRYFWKGQRIRPYEWLASYSGADSLYFDQPNCAGHAFMQIVPGTINSPTARYVGLTGGHVLWLSEPNVTPVNVVGSQSALSEQPCMNLATNGTYSCECVPVTLVGDLDLLFTPPFKIVSSTQKRRAVSP